MDNNNRFVPEGNTLIFRPNRSHPPRSQSNQNQAAEWNCSNCGISNYNSKTNCRKCQQQRPSDASNSKNTIPNNKKPQNQKNQHKNQSTSSSKPPTNGQSNNVNNNNKTPTKNGVKSEAQEAPIEPFRKFFDLILKVGVSGLDKPLDEPAARKFFKAILGYSDVSDLVFRLDTSPNGKPAIKDCMKFLLESQNLNELVIPFLAKLGSDELSHGPAQQSVTKILHSMFKIPYFLMQLLKNLPQLTEPVNVGWFLLKVVSSAGEEFEEARQDPTVKEIAEKLVAMKSTQEAAVGRHLMNVIKGSSVPAPSAVPALMDIKELPGNRHSNDHINFRSIAIIPSADEVTSTTVPYLPHASDLVKHEESGILDRQFRLLREDFVAPLREELILMKKDASDPKAKSAKRWKKRIFKDIKFEAMAADERAGPTFFSVTFEQPLKTKDKDANQKNPDNNQNSKKKQESPLKTYWEESRFLLPDGALVCFVRDGLPIRFGVVCQRDTTKLSANVDRAEIGIRFQSKNDKRATIAELGAKIPPTVMVQVSSSFFAFDPILKGLQGMQQVPLEEEIAHLNPSPQAPSGLWSVLEQVKSSADVTSLVKANKPIVLDPTQHEALKLALTKRVALIQGPPGTGKSFIGTLAAKIIQDYTASVIMCVCYTNHALDQFLEDLLDIGVPPENLLRVGGSHKVSDRIKPFTLFNLGQGQFGKAEGRRWRESKDKMSDLRTNIAGAKVPTEQNLSWVDVESFLEMEEKFSELYQLKLPTTSLGEEALVGKKGKKLKSDGLWKIWKKGDTLPEYLKSADGPLWKMKQKERQHLIKSWMEEIQEPFIDRLLNKCADYDHEESVMQRLRICGKVPLLASKRIIGCTTTGAAKNIDLLNSIAADVLIVEEAGEILEAHILTSLGRKTKHLIMIGDHKQLRPKVSVFDLMVESKKGFDLNRSLFERLILAEFPHVTLELQHRMHPEISDTIRQITYPKLRDAASVNSHPPVRGLSQRVVFIDHQNLEDGNDTESQQVLVEGLSKTNQFEVQMIVKINRYLLQQGYKPEQLVILTPYLGQVMKIKKALEKDNQTSALSKQDIKDLKQLGVVVSTQKDQKGVRVSSIDNYQGEEADVVIASLVRSNKNGSIGFLREPERVNVLLSRARHGMILIGNSQTLLSAKDLTGRELWKKVMSLLERTGSVLKGLPVQCKRHPTEINILSTPDQFRIQVPDGGCIIECKQPLPCGLHTCPRKCHPVEDHSNVTCTARMEDYCPNGHPLTFPCHDKDKLTSKKCWACEDLKKKEEEAKQKLKEQQLEEARQRAADEAKYKAAQQEVQLAEQQLKAEEERKQREIEVQNLRIKKEMLEKEAQLKKQYRDQEVQQHTSQAELAAKQSLQNTEEQLKAKLAQSENNNNNTTQHNKPQPTSSTSPQKSQSNSSVNDKNQATSSPAITDSNMLENLKKANVAAFNHLSLNKLQNYFGDKAANAFQTQPSPFNQILKPGLKFLQAPPKFTDAIKFFQTKKDDIDAQYLEAFSKMKLDETPGPLPDHFTIISCYVSAMIYEHKKQLPAACGFALAFLKWLPSFKDDVPSSWESDMKALLEKCVDELSGVNNKTEPTKPGPKEEWEHEKNVKFAKSAALDKLMNMTGLTIVKEELLRVYRYVTLEKTRGNDPTKMRYHARLEGNPGTGKTTVARIYSELLLELGAISGGHFEETSGAKLADGGVAGLQKILGAIEAAGGGVLFVDEAYQLDPQSSLSGKAVLNLLLTELENKIGKLVIAFAGYQKDIEKLIEANEGLPSRFGYRFNFADYTDDELLSILQGVVRSSSSNPVKKFHAEGGDNGKPMIIASRRLGSRRGPGFGNARDVKNFVEQVLRRQAERLSKKPALDDYLLTEEDLLGPNPTNFLEKSKPWKKLEVMVGLTQVKDAVRSMVHVVQRNYELEQELKPRRAIALNRVFLGNPGTGKTTVAKLYAEILKDLGLLSKGEVVFKTASDFVGAVIGESEKKTNTILKSAEGCVLVIDEAYGLFDKGSAGAYKESVINTLVEKVQNVPGEDKCVILIGYKEQMEEMMRESNPGLKRRFDLENAFVFQDYTDDELMKILSLKLKERELEATYEAKEAAIDLLAQQRKQPNFGNGGNVENIISGAVKRFDTRTSKLPQHQRKDAKILPDDMVPPKKEVKLEDVFSDIIGCQEVMNQLKEYHKVITAQKARGMNPFEDLELNFVFAGSPGTGKTTVAKRMGMMFKSLGILGSDEVCCHSASELQAQYVGQTAPLARKLMENALGKVLFIDEAYRLKPNRGNFMEEAVNELVQMLTEDKFKNKMIVILAGYERDMDELLQVNPGLRSRFSTTLKFHDFSVADCWTLLKLKLDQGQKILHQSVQDALDPLMKKFVKVPQFGNGRDIETLAKRISREMDITRDDPTQPDTLDGKYILKLSEVEKPLQALIQEKTKMLPQNANLNSNSNQTFEFQTANETPKSSSSSTSTATDNNNEKRDNKPKNPNDECASGRDPGVSDDVWRQLQIDLKIQQEKEEARRKEIQRLEEERRRAEEEARRAEQARKELEERLRQEAEEKKRQELERLRLLQEEAEKKRREEQQRRERESQRLLEEQRNEQEAQKKLRQMGICPAGFQWIKQSGGYRCGGGSHWISDHQLNNY